MSRLIWVGQICEIRTDALTASCHAASPVSSASDVLLQLLPTHDQRDCSMLQPLFRGSEAWPGDGHGKSLTHSPKCRCSFGVLLKPAHGAAASRRTRFLLSLGINKILLYLLHAFLVLLYQRTFRLDTNKTLSARTKLGYIL